VKFQFEITKSTFKKKRNLLVLGLLLLIIPTAFAAWYSIFTQNNTSIQTTAADMQAFCQSLTSNVQTVPPGTGFISYYCPSGSSTNPAYCQSGQGCAAFTFTAAGTVNATWDSTQITGVTIVSCGTTGGCQLDTSCNSGSPVPLTNGSPMTVSLSSQGASYNSYTYCVTYNVNTLGTPIDFSIVWAQSS
jgi:hypothetical protein